jgi:glutamate-1-semialdehyde 2,1-aminomutase
VIIGKEKHMSAAQNTFISSTYWTDRIGPTAAIATIKKFVKNNVSEHLIEVGKRAQGIWTKYSQKHDVPLSEIAGIYPLSHFGFKHSDPLIIKTLFTKLMLDEGFLGTTEILPSFAHKKEHIDKYELAIDNVFGKLKGMLNNPEDYLKTPVCHSKFKRLN